MRFCGSKIPFLVIINNSSEIFVEKLLVKPKTYWMAAEIWLVTPAWLSAAGVWQPYSKWHVLLFFVQKIKTTASFDKVRTIFPKGTFYCKIRRCLCKRIIIIYVFIFYLFKRSNICTYMHDITDTAIVMQKTKKNIINYWTSCYGQSWATSGMTPTASPYLPAVMVPAASQVSSSGS